MNKAFEFKANVPVKVTFSYDQPKTGEGQYGIWYRYGATINGQEETFFAPAKLHEELQKLGVRKGSVVEITMVAEIGQNGKAYKHYLVNKIGVGSAFAQQGIAKETKEAEQEKWDRLGWGKCKTLFLVEAFKFIFKEGKTADKEVQEATEMIAEQWADMSMRKLEPGLMQASKSQEDNQGFEDDFNTEEIPF